MGVLLFLCVVTPLMGWGRSGGPGWVFSFFFVWFTHLRNGGAQVAQLGCSLFSLCGDPTYGMGALRFSFFFVWFTHLWHGGAQVTQVGCFLFFVWFTHLWDGGAQVGQVGCSLFSLFGLPTDGMGALRSLSLGVLFFLCVVYPLMGGGRSGRSAWVSFFFAWFTHLWDGGAQVAHFRFSFVWFTHLPLFGLPTYGMGALRLARLGVLFFLCLVYPLIG